MFEIHTSMSEELIIDELCQMKKKFAPIGKVTAEKFDLLILPPQNENGRRRGGFVHDFHGRQEWGFIVRFREEAEGTLIDVKLVQTEKLPFIHNRAKIDRFWKQKLGVL